MVVVTGFTSVLVVVVVPEPSAPEELTINPDMRAIALNTVAGTVK
jgi:hypothetical protein